jgi:hypothetical protein
MMCFGRRLKKNGQFHQKLFLSNSILGLSTRQEGIFLYLYTQKRIGGGQRFRNCTCLKLESSSETLQPPALVYSCKSPQFYLLKGSDNVASTYYSVNFLLTCFLFLP